MTRFQIIFTGILIALGVGGVISFALVKNQGSQGAPAIVMWGTIKSDSVNRFLSNVSASNRESLNVSYVEKSLFLFESDLVSALARGNGPDLVLLPQDLMLQQLDKFYVIPYANYSQRLFKDSFIQEGELYLDSNGIIAFPFSVDPMVMYWNRDIFTNEGLSLPPISWTELFTLAPKIVKRDVNGNITQSLVAFGEVRNVSHSKEIISLLSLQAGTPIVTRNTQNSFVSVFNASVSSGLIPGEEAVSYFTEFSNPNKASYSWNRSLALDKNAFVGGRLALYFGFASELASIRAANPNLNFDVAQVPQTGGNRVTFGAMNGIALLKASKNVPAAYAAAVTLTSGPLQTEWLNESGYPPVRREMLVSAPEDAYKSVFYSSALISNAWLDPNRQGTTDIFARLVENVTSGRMRVSEAVNTASKEMGTYLNIQR